MNQIPVNVAPPEDAAIILPIDVAPLDDPSSTVDPSLITDAALPAALPICANPDLVKEEIVPADLKAIADPLDDPSLMSDIEVIPTEAAFLPEDPTIGANPDLVKEEIVSADLKAIADPLMADIEVIPTDAAFLPQDPTIGANPDLAKEEIVPADFNLKAIADPAIHLDSDEESYNSEEESYHSEEESYDHRPIHINSLLLVDPVTSDSESNDSESSDSSDEVISATSVLLEVGATLFGDSASATADSSEIITCNVLDCDEAYNPLHPHLFILHAEERHGPCAIICPVRTCHAIFRQEDKIEALRHGFVTGHGQPELAVEFYERSF